ncbi:MAG: Wadjet anti-phage system protein JetA family protein [Actinomycetota bacterium]
MSLFDHIPERIFRPLAAGNRRFYAALLLHLYDHTFAAIGDTPRKTDVIAEVGDFMDQYGPLVDEETDLSPQEMRRLQREAGGQDTERYRVFNYLVDSGWLVEMRDRFRRLVDLTPEGRLLLREFQKIILGDSRSYGGAVLNVLGQLDAAVDHADDRSECVFNAWTYARDFSHHLRTIAAQMRRLEEHVLAQQGLRALFRAFFDEFVSKMLIADYKTLKTRNNPFRFRHQIIERVRQIEADALLMSRLARAYVREGRGETPVAAEARIRRELQDVHHVFETIDRQLDVIAETQVRIERKIHTIVRYMDRHDGGAIDRATRAIRALGRTGLPLDAEVWSDPHILLLDPLLGGDILYTQRQGRREIERSRFREVPMDPALEAFRKAKLDYARRVAVSPQRMRDFLAKVLDGRDSILGSEIEVITVDDFIVFQRLRDVPFMFDGLLAKHYTVTPLERRAANEWLDFPDFQIARVRKGA